MPANRHPLFCMKNKGLLFVFILLFGIASCMDSCNCKCCKECATSAYPITTSIHNPIYPKPDTPVSFSLFLKNEAEISSVHLKITVEEYTSSGTWTTVSTVIEKSWSSPYYFPLVHQVTDGFSKNQLVTYVFTVTPKEGAAYEHAVSFATNPYPLSMFDDDLLKQPAPVYVTASIDSACNLVFIPDEDMTGVEVRESVDWIEYFYNTVRDNILNGIFNEPTTQSYYRGFNFFINPLSGKVDPGAEIFFQPENYLSLDFMQGKTFIHNAEFRDFSNKSLTMRTSSSRIYNCGTFLHESGHVLFFLDDEYEYGVRDYSALTPNAWKSYTDAQAAAPGFGLNDEHILLINEPAASIPGYILCPFEGCQMGMGGLSIVHFGRPCQKAVQYWMDTYINP